MSVIIKPRRFTGLHAHSTAGSVGDAIGLPQEHIDYAVSNGMDSLALTDHGNQNGISHQKLHEAKLRKEGKAFKAIPGLEAYFADSLSNWQVLYEQARVNGDLAPKKKKATAKPVEAVIGNDLAGTESELEEIADEKKIDADSVGNTGVEDEDASKSNKFKNPLYQREHLVILPKSSQGLKNLFKIVSASYIEGFYRVPRVDLAMIKEHGKGELICLSACIAGVLSRVVFDHQVEPDWTKWGPNDVNFELIQTALKAKTEKFIDALGEGNFFAELQFNRLGAQHLVNQHLIELHKRTGIQLVVTADSHYSNPEHWKEREIYKAMAWANKTKGKLDPKDLAQTVDELKCELYPKNAEQIWETYKTTTAGMSFYDDQLVCDAVERTYDIAQNVIGDVQIDKRVKLPGIGLIMEPSHLTAWKAKLGNDTDEDTLALKEIVQLAVAGLKRRGFAENQVDKRIAPPIAERIWKRGGH